MNELIADFDGRCHYCTAKVKIGVIGNISNRDATRDHVQPLKHGGSWKRHNIVLCCRKCNLKRNELF